MSASEKLKALEVRTRSDDDAMGELSVYAPWLLESFPQIVAVVEAAEWTSESGVYSYERHVALTTALAALDQALGDD